MYNIIFEISPNFFLFESKIIVATYYDELKAKYKILDLYEEQKSELGKTVSSIFIRPDSTSFEMKIKIGKRTFTINCFIEER